MGNVVCVTRLRDPSSWKLGGSLDRSRAVIDVDRSWAATIFRFISRTGHVAGGSCDRSATVLKRRTTVALIGIFETSIRVASI